MRKADICSCLILIVSLLASCNRYEELEAPRETDWIRFTTGDGIIGSGLVETKALENEITCEITDWEYDDNLTDTKVGLVESVYDSVGVFGYNYSTWSSSALPNMMYNLKSTLDGESLTPVTKVLWKNATNDSVRFYAYAPYNVGTVSGQSDGGTPYLTYTVPASASNQMDILYAQSEDLHKSNRTAVPMRFKHAMAAVQFRLGIEEATLTSVQITKVKNQGKLSLDGTWSDLAGNTTFTITDQNSVLVMIPQTLADGPAATDSAMVTLNYHDSTGDHSISASIGKTEWTAGKKVVYTLKKKTSGVEYIYFDLYCGDIIITDATYSGYICVNGKDSLVSGTHLPTNKYYIYHSASATYTGTNESIKYKNTGYATVADFKNRANVKPRIPQYSPITIEGKSWKEYITNNTKPEEVLASWTSIDENITTVNRILITGDSYFDVTLDRIYSRYFPYLNTASSTSPETYASIRTVNETREKFGGLTIGAPRLDAYDDNWNRTYKEKVTLRLKGNNYFSRISYSKPVSSSADGYLKITSEKGDGIAEGTLTVTLPKTRKTYKSTVFKNFSRCALIGGGNAGSGDDTKRQVSDLYFNGGVVYVGLEEIADSKWTANTNLMTCIGAVNSSTEIEINGGILTAVAYGPGPAIGGGAGWDNYGGKGYITINSGTVYAWCFGVKNEKSGCPVKGTAIGGGSSGTAVGKDGEVTVNGGTIYAYSVGGAAIGGGTSGLVDGGASVFTMNGGHVYAKSLAGTIGDLEVSAGTSVGGGGSGITSGNGGSATMNVNNGFIQAGSVGGGSCANSTGKIGRAKIAISGGEISAQFLLVKDKSELTANEFTMTDGAIKNSFTSDSTYRKVQGNGGAVYIESGTCTISGGTISNCIGSLGGAVYMNGGTFKMTGGKIADCKSETDGGAVYVEGGDAHVDGGQIYHNIASKGNGGGVYIKGGNFSMKQGGTGKILNNAADCNPIMVGGSYYGGNGGGIYISSTTSNPTVDIFGGKIQYNAADRNGGGLCIDMPDPAHSASIKIGYSGGTYVDPDISLNSAALSGGGMSVQGSGSNIEIYCGTVKGNVSAIVKNEDIRNDGGTVDLLGKNIPGETPQVNVLYNTIHYYANNGDDPEPNDEQRVITATNSPLHPTAKALAFEKEFYHLVSWNTRRDGTGTAYDLNGTDAVMNITTDVNLYGQWVRNQ